MLAAMGRASSLSARAFLHRLERPDARGRVRRRDRRLGERSALDRRRACDSCGTAIGLVVAVVPLLSSGRRGPQQISRRNIWRPGSTTLYCAFSGGGRPIAISLTHSFRGSGRSRRWPCSGHRPPFCFVAAADLSHNHWLSRSRVSFSRRADRLDAAGDRRKPGDGFHLWGRAVSRAYSAVVACGHGWRRRRSSLLADRSGTFADGMTASRLSRAYIADRRALESTWRGDSPVSFSAPRKPFEFRMQTLACRSLLLSCNGALCVALVVLAFSGAISGAPARSGSFIETDEVNVAERLRASRANLRTAGERHPSNLVRARVRADQGIRFPFEQFRRPLIAPALWPPERKR